MARLLYPSDSTAFLLKVLRRFIRLARKQKGAEFLAQQMAPCQQSLIEKQAATQLVDEKREDVYDDILITDSDLDEAIRTTFESCAQYDRKNPGGQLVTMAFPNGTYSDIIRMPYAEEPKEAERIAASLEKLGDKHSIYPHVTEIRAKIAAVNAALDAYKQVITELTRAEVDEETAKAEVRKQYEFAYLDARKKLGKRYAERVFPAISAKTKAIVVEQTVAK
jgi:hypothetical protein